MGSGLGLSVAVTLYQRGGLSVLARGERYEYVPCLACRANVRRLPRDDCQWCHGSGEVLQPTPPLAHYLAERRARGTWP